MPRKKAEQAVSPETASTEPVAPEAPPTDGAGGQPSKPKATRGRKAKTPDSERDEGQSPSPKEQTPASPLALIFQAPDLPTPVIDAKRGVPIEPQGKQTAASGDDSHLRRRSRRRASDQVDADELPPNTVVKVRTPREPKEPSNEPQKVKGSTRIEAKRQRRRDGRDGQRRRSTISESEFLARREAVERFMVVREHDDKIQIGVLEDGILVEHYIAKSSEGSLIGNVYLGKVQNVLSSMEAAFVDIGRGRNAVLYSGEVDWELAETGNQPRRIELALKSGDSVLVQVTKDPVGQKGARLTSQVSLPGRYLVFVPNGNMNGISRKLPESERTRLKKILKEILPEDAGVIVRTAAEGASEEQLTLDVERLKAQWEEINKKGKKKKAPLLLHSEPDLLIKIIRDVFNEDFQKLLISGDQAFATITEYVAAVAPDLLERVEQYRSEVDIFEHYRIGEQVAKALERKVYLPSGGSLVIDRTEAMTVVDVNTGKFVGSGGNLEETVTKNNLEAAEEIVRQLRLRDIGGIIVIDFIDMVLESNRDLVQRRLMECLSRDRTKHQVAEVTSLGLVQMTRKKLGLGLLETLSETCEVCAGRGVIVYPEPVMRARSGSNAAGQGSGKGRRSKPEIEKAKVVTPEQAVEIKSVMAKIAASTLGASDTPSATASAEVSEGDGPAEHAPERDVAEASSVTDATDVAATTDAAATTDGAATTDAAASLDERQKLLDAVLDALPEPEVRNSRGRKPRRASSADVAAS